jgi:hypothetical protein
MSLHLGREKRRATAHENERPVKGIFVKHSFIQLHLGPNVDVAIVNIPREQVKHGLTSLGPAMNNSQAFETQTCTFEGS